MAKVEEFTDPNGQIVPLNSVGESVVRGFVIKPGEPNKDLDDFLNKDTISIQLLDKKLDENNNMILYFLGILKKPKSAEQASGETGFANSSEKPNDSTTTEPVKKPRKKRKPKSDLPEDTSPGVSFEII